MKALLSYLVTQNVLSRFEKTVSFQEKYFPEAIQKIDKVVITDATTPIRVNWPVVRSDIFINGLFNQSRAKNTAFRYATENGYDWLFDGDADRVLLNYPDEFPEPGLAALPIYYANEGESEDQIYRKFLSYELQWVGSSFFVMHRTVFSRLKACEDFIVNRFEDLDFVFNVCRPNKIKTVSVKALSIHLYHSDAERAFKYEAHNK